MSKDILKATDKLYIEFVESMDMDIPDNDCTDYRDQDDYRAMEFTFNKISHYKQEISKLRDQLAQRDEAIKLMREALDLWNETGDTYSINQAAREALAKAEQILGDKHEYRQGN